MKKLGLFFLMAMLFVSALALAVSADEIPEWTEITELDKMSDKVTFGADGTKGATSRVLMDDGKTYPAYYICKDSTTLTLTYSEISKYAGKTYKAANVVRIEIPIGITTTSDMNFRTADGYKNLVTAVLPEGVTNIAPFMFKAANKGDSSLVSVSIPSTVTEIGKEAFYRCNKITELVFPEGVESFGNSMLYEGTVGKINFPSSLKSIGDSAFRSADFGTDTAVLPEGLTTIGDYAFKGSKITSVVIPSTFDGNGIQHFMECSNIRSVVCRSSVIATQMFSTCVSIESVILENTVSIGKDAFYSKAATPLKSLVLPETLTSIGELAFARAGITELVIPASLTEVAGEVFKECKSLQRVVFFGSVMGKNMFYNCSALTTLVITDKIESFGDGALTGVSSKTFTTFYTGSDYDRIKTLMNDATRITSAKCSSYESYVAGTHEQNQYIFIYDANLCELVYEGHLEDNNPCVINCERCGWYGVAEKNPVHVQSVTMVYDSFDMAGKKVTFCTNEGCQYHDDVEASALFTFIGDSVPEFGIAGITLCYRVNDDAINKYKAVMGDTFEYGVFAVRESVIGEKDVLDENGKFQEGVLGCNLSGNKYGAFELKIVGFTTDEQKATKIAMGAYVVTGEDRKISYMQAGTPSEGQKYYSVSYSDIIG